MKISEFSKLTKLYISTLRYYDAQGLLPNIKRDKEGNRNFDQQDINTIKIIECLKISGLNIKEIKKFMDWCQEGDTTIEKRLKLFQKQEKNIKQEIEKLTHSLYLIQYKEWYYQKAKEDKTEDFVKKMKKEEIQKKFKFFIKKQKKEVTNIMH